MIPTVNSARWLGHVIDYYRNIDLKVIFAVDTRTSDGTTSLLSAKGSKFVMVRGQHPRVESLIGEIVAKVDAEWILRIDDDELPSPGMLRWADKVIGARLLQRGDFRVSIVATMFGNVNLNIRNSYQSDHWPGEIVSGGYFAGMRWS